MKKGYNLLLICLLISIHAMAQIAKTQVIRISATANADGSITLTWPYENFAGNYDIYKRLNQQTQNWGSAPIASIAGTFNQYKDVAVKEGEAFEYQIVKRQGSTNVALGYIYAGNAFPEPKQYPAVILLIDSNFRLPLSTQINQLQADLYKEGYVLYIDYAGRGEAVNSVRNRVKAIYQNALIKPASLFILGHVPVPYSGYYSSNSETPPPDGHVEGSGNHTGAWPADVVYGILGNGLTDDWVDCKTGSQPRNYNVVGDGKFDQSKLPSEAVLEVGRVDLFNMPAFKKSDTALTAAYLDRNHAWRTGVWKVQERALVDNNFASLNLASTGYANFAALVGSNLTYDTLDYITAQKKGSYLWSYGCGAGSYTNCNGIGSTTSFVNDSFENVFTILAGSFFGDWDVQNNLLRAPIASKSLASFWGGIPKWYVHHMGLGERIGKGTQISQNNTNFYFSGQFNLSENSMHIALMGDPTLRMKNLPAVSNLSAISENKVVKLLWSPVSEPGLGYAVYLVDTLSNTFYRLNDVPETGTTYNHDKNYVTGNYQYAVRAIKLETGASGTYFNAGGAAYARVNHINGTQEKLVQTIQVSCYPNPIINQQNLTVDVQLVQSNAIATSLYSMEGKLLLQQNFEEARVGLNQININMARQNPGIYLLKIASGSSSHVQKIVVQ
ncbi:MAG: T9SS type A sorting domain-containing protein [bacterium]|nr:T9SS type A sorting domain-containing protein [bacterium]